MEDTDKERLVRIENGMIELVKQGAVHNELLRTHESRSLALQAQQEILARELAKELDPVKKHVNFVDRLLKFIGAVVVTVFAGAALQLILKLF